jgi:hypothetical protein
MKIINFYENPNIVRGSNAATLAQNAYKNEGKRDAYF